MTAVAPPPLPADLVAGLRRLKLASMRAIAPELLVTAKTQRWSPEDFLRTLIDAEITSRTPPTPEPATRPPTSRSPNASTSSTSPPRRSRPPPSTTWPPWSG